MLPQSLTFVAGQLTLHVTLATVPLTVAVNVCWAPAASVADGGLSKTGACGAVLVGVSVTVAVAVTVVSCCEMAWTVTDDVTRIVDGAVYKPELDITPTDVFPPLIPFTCQLTAVFVAFVTVATNCVVWFGVSVTAVGDSVTVTAVDELLLLLLPPHPVRKSASTDTTTTTGKNRISRPFSTWGIPRPVLD